MVRLESNGWKCTLFSADDNAVSLINNGKSLAVPNELSDIGIEIVSGQTVLINLRTANLKIIWKSNVSSLINEQLRRQYHISGTVSFNKINV